MRIVLILLSLSFSLPAAEQPPRPQKRSVGELPSDLQHLISKFALHGAIAPDYQALANMITAMGSLITPETLIRIFESLPTRVLASNLIPYLKDLHAIQDARVQDWFKNIKLQDGEKLIKAMSVKNPDINNIAQMLANPNIDVNARGAGGITALMLASSHGQPEIVKLLLATGANPNVKEHWHGWTALIFASKQGYIKIVQLLLAAGANVNENDADDNTALINASEKGRTIIVLLLLEAGADTTKKNRFGENALSVAQKSGHMCTAQLLLENSKKRMDLLHKLKINTADLFL